MDELLALIRKMMGEGKSAADISKAIQGDSTTQPVFQAGFDRGHSDATQRAKTRETELETSVTALTAERNTATQKVADLQAATPDVKKVTEDFQAEIAKINTKHKAEKDTMTQTVTAERRGRAGSDLKAALIGLDVDPDFAEVQTQKPEVQARIRFGDQGETQVMADGKDIPLTVGEGQTPLTLLANELKAKVPPKFLTSNADRGSATGHASTVGLGTPVGTSFDAIRKQVGDKYKSTAPRGMDALATRMGVPKVA